VWNIATEAMNKYGAPTPIAQGYRGGFDEMSTGLMELEGMTGKLTEEVPVIRLVGHGMPKVSSIFKNHRQMTTNRL